VAPFAGVAVRLARDSDALTTVGATVDEAAEEGERLGVLVVFLAAGAALVVAALALASARVTVPRLVRLAYGALLVIALAYAGSAAVARFGHPVEMATDAYHAFRGPPVGISAEGSDLNQRIFNLSGNGRYVLWETAWEYSQRERLFGSGAGSFVRSWQAERPFALQVRDAHSLYFEVLAELGPIGLGLLLVALLTPLVAALRTRSHPLVPFAAAAYVTWLAHIGVDWDWEMPLVMIVGFTCGAALLLAARRRPPRPLNRAVRFGLLSAVLATGAFALVGLIGNSAYERAEAAQEEGRLTEAREQARKATRWAPWSAEPWKLRAELGATQAAARGYLLEAIAAEPNDFESWLALSYVTEGRERRRAIRQARRLNPLDPGVVARATEIEPSPPVQG
jgi:hypothetical protein